MAATLSTSTTELGESRVRVDVEVAPAALEAEVEAAGRELGRDLRIPGFRKGKVPARVVLQRIGREAVLEEAVRRGLPNWYGEAVSNARVATVGEPRLDLPEAPERGEPLRFSFEVAVRPKARLGNYRGLEVGRREPAVEPAEIDAEIERLRDSVSTLETVERPGEPGLFVVVDFIGRIEGEPFEGGEAQGLLLELGAGRLIPGFEEQLAGASAGDEREVNVTFPDDYQPEHLAGAHAVFTVQVREVKEKHLPDLDDEFASEAAGFDTLEELREDVERRLAKAQERTIEAEFREAVVDAAAAEATVELSHDLVHAKGHEMWEQTARRLRAQGVDPQRYLELAGKNEEELVHETEGDAERALRRESVLAAVVEAEGLGASDEELFEALRQSALATGGGQPSERKLRNLLAKAEEDGRAELLREDIAMRKAVDLLVEAAVPVSVEQAKARDKLWTPEKGEKEPSAAGPGRLWTPGE